MVLIIVGSGDLWEFECDCFPNIVDIDLSLLVLIEVEYFFDKVMCQFDHDLGHPFFEKDSLGLDEAIAQKQLIEILLGEQFISFLSFSVGHIHTQIYRNFNYI